MNFLLDVLKCRTERNRLRAENGRLKADDAPAVETGVVVELKRGQRYVWNLDKPRRDWVFVEVNRVAKDGSWADVFACNWACGWTKRQPLERIQLTPFEWTQADLDAQMAVWDSPLTSRAVLVGRLPRPARQKEQHGG